MEHPEIKATWKEICTQKGAETGIKEDGLCKEGGIRHRHLQKNLFKNQ